MVISEAELLQQRAEAGDPAAQMTLAILLDNRGMHDHAVNWLRTASESGHVEAQFVLGARLIVGRAAPFDPEEGAKWVRASADQGFSEALKLMGALASMTGDWDQAVMFTKNAAAAGDERAQAQISLLADKTRFQSERWDAPVEIAWQSLGARVGVIRDFIPHAFCDWMIERAKPKLKAAQLKGAANSDHRTNSGAGFSLLESDLILQMVNARVADVTDIPIQNHEPTNVLHYAPGQEYKAHFDFITASEANRLELSATGQRVATALIYLNDGFGGGETDFPTLNWRFKGQKGDALVFWNVSETGEPDRRTLHAGLPVTGGEKWLYSKWMRANPYPLI